LLPGESLHEFEAIRQMIVDDVQPETNIEWLWTPDLVELSWEIGFSRIFVAAPRPSASLCKLPAR
jgi:hypothetical protein